MLESLKNLNKFKVAGVLTSVLYFYLFVALLVSPDSVFEDFGITGIEAVHILARRVSMLMLGFSALLFLSRNIPPSTARQAISFSIALNMAGFALMSSMELIRGFARTSIVSVIVIETLVAVVYFYLLVSDRRQSNKSHS